SGILRTTRCCGSPRTSCRGKSCCRHAEERTRAMMHPHDEHLRQQRRDFLATSASGLGTLAVASLLRDEGLLAAEEASNPLAPRPPHFAPKARACICIYLEGGPSQIDLFDPKPKLNELDGKPLPESMTKNVRFAFLRKESARLMGSPRVFKK